MLGICHNYVTDTLPIMGNGGTLSSDFWRMGDAGGDDCSGDDCSDDYFNVALKLTERLTGSVSFAAASVDFALPANVLPGGLSSLTEKIPEVLVGKSPS